MGSPSFVHKLRRVNLCVAGYFRPHGHSWRLEATGTEKHTEPQVDRTQPNRNMWFLFDFIVENSRLAASLDGGNCNSSVYLSARQASQRGLDDRLARVPYAATASLFHDLIKDAL